jgi:serine/threonine protein kinase
MDLRSYGINTTLVDETSMNIHEDQIPRGHYSDGRFNLSSGNYSIERKLGEGSYGKIYEVMSETSGNLYAIKVQKYESQEEFQDYVKEAIMNIILENASQTQPNGPYVQRFYEIAHDVLNKVIFMRIQMLDGTLADLIDSRTPEENDRLIPDILQQIAVISEFFQTTLAMNHRDMKSNNIMYSMHEGIPHVKLIDLGLSCMTYKGIHISGGGVFPSTHTCNRKSRDLTFLLLELLLDFPDKMSPKLYEMLRKLLKFKTPHSECQMNGFCVEEGLAEWKNSYIFLNRKNIENPHTTVKEIKTQMTAFTKKLKSVRSTKRRRATYKKHVFRGFLYA